MPYKSKPGARKYGDNPLKDKGYTPFKMKGHTLPGINQRLDDHPKVAEQGLSGSSPFQHDPGPGRKHPHKNKMTMNRKGDITYTDTHTGESATYKKGKTYTPHDKPAVTEYVGPKGSKKYMRVKTIKKGEEGYVDPPKKKSPAKQHGKYTKALEEFLK